MILRIIEDKIKSFLFKEKVIVLYGPRQVGKTTLMKKIYDEYDGVKQFLDCDLEEVKLSLTKVNLERLRILIGQTTLLCIDEAQRVPNIGLTLKILADNFRHIQIIATGSSSFEIANNINEPLTGRKFEFLLLPLSTQELWPFKGGFQEHEALESRLIYGYYPDIINTPEEAQVRILELSKSYLFKDVFEFEEIRNSKLLNLLLKALAYQVGNQVSYNELARITSASPKTIERYIGLLEQTFVVFKLHSFSRNLRNELSKSFKVYFYDNGMRNAIISEFKPLGLRNDIGALWENYLISERVKYLKNNRLIRAGYFWRTTQQQEVDYIEEHKGVLNAYEFKYSPNKKARLTKTFSRTYPNHTFNIVNNQNYMNFVGVQ